MNPAIKDIPLPYRIAELPIDERGYPVPWFVAWFDGKPDFRVVDPRKFGDAVRFKKCWVCGEQLGKHLGFVIGPMCAVNRISSEPPSHRDCAMYAVRACPFLANPNMRRNEHKLPDEVQAAAGVMIRRNPGVTLLWMTQSYKVIQDGNKGYLIEVGEPNEVLFFKEGRKATREEVMESIDSGLPFLRDAAKQDGPKAEAFLEKQLSKALQLVPA